MKVLHFVTIFFCCHFAHGDISEYFHKLKADAHTDYFRKMPPQKLVQKFSMESRSPSAEVDFSDYYDYFGIDPTPAHAKVNAASTMDDMNVADDILSDVKKPYKGFNRKMLKSTKKSKYPYKKRHSSSEHRDNVAMAHSHVKSKLMTKRVSRPKSPSK